MKGGTNHGKLTPTTSRVCDHRRVVCEPERGDGDHEVVAALLRDEMLVSAGDLAASSEVRRRVGRLGTRAGSLLEDIPVKIPAARRRALDVEIWRLRPDVDVLAELDSLLQLRIGGRRARVAPSHVLVPAKWHYCPGGPPSPAHAPKAGIRPFAKGRGKVEVVVLDSGYILGSALDRRGGVAHAQGLWFDPVAGAWTAEPPDVLDANGDAVLDGIAGHGTFVAGVIARGCRKADILVVGHRHLDLATSEIAVARSLIEYGHADVIQCGFAFPGVYVPSLRRRIQPLALAAAVSLLPRSTVVVSPAGNSSSPLPHWPAAHKRVIGVAATNRSGNRAPFSNFAPPSGRRDAGWVDCATLGIDVISTHVRFRGPAEDDTTLTPFRFDGWSRWSGTSFSAPRVTALIASELAKGRLTNPAETARAAAARILGDPTKPTTEALGVLL